MSGMQPVRFGPDASLVGLHHEPGRLPARGAVLLCGPPGPEASSLHRTLRVLGDRLARTGYHVLRFDYYATGDSLGAPVEARIARWEADVRDAHEMLVRISGQDDVSWVGFRLGATLAALASVALPLPLRSLILCEPVFDGRIYLGELVRLHDTLLDRVLGVHRRRTARANGAWPEEVVGLPLNPEFRDALLGLRLALAAPPRTRSLVVLGGASDLAQSGFAEVIGRALIPTEFAQVETAAWNGADALESTILRGDIVTAVASRLET